MGKDRKQIEVSGLAMEEDPNFIAFKEQEAWLREHYSGKIVAFVEGKFVIGAHQSRKRDMLAWLRTKYKGKQPFIRVVGDDEPIDIPTPFESD